MLTLRAGREEEATAQDALPRNPIAASALIAVLVLVACEVGIHSRLLFSLASIWPANALLLGTLLVWPRTNRPLTWALAALAYAFADFTAGTPALDLVLLNASNLVGVACGLLVGRLVQRKATGGNPSLDTMSVVLVIAVASAAAAIGGCICGRILFDMDLVSSFGLWFSAEMVNHALFLPILLALGSSDERKLRLFSRDRLRARQQVAALFTLALLVVAMHAIGGPLAGAYIVPGILWCAVVFRPFAASLLAMLVCGWILIAGPMGLIPLRIDFSAVTDAASFRLGVGMVATGVYAVSTLNGAWRAAHEKLRHVASHDELTGLMNRGALMRRLSQRLALPGSFSVLMLDIDLFKSINDSHGHAAGDMALQLLAKELRARLSEGEFAGRLGGEEFALVVERPLEGAIAFAEELREAVPRMSRGDGKPAVRFTISVGVAEARQHEELERCLAAADQALYAAKHAGRNQVVAFQHLPGADAGTA